MLKALLTPWSALNAMRELGGPVVLWIFAACLTMWTIVLERYWYFRHTLPLQTSLMLEQWKLSTVWER